MAEQKFEPESLEALAERIVEFANQADDKTIQAALLVREARDRVNSGEAGNTTWYEWAPKNIGLSKTRLWELQRIADAEDHHKELERLRRAAQERAEKHRRNKKAKQTLPLGSGTDKTVKSPAEPEMEQRSPIKTSSEQAGEQLEDQANEPPLRNGGDATATVEVIDEQDQRDRVAAWARSAPVHHVRQVLVLIESLEQAELGSDPEDPAAPKAA